MTVAELSSLERRTLNLLLSSNGPLLAARLRTELHTSGSNITQALERLASRGLIKWAKGEPAEATGQSPPPAPAPPPAPNAPRARRAPRTRAPRGRVTVDVPVKAPAPVEYAEIGSPGRLVEIAALLTQIGEELRALATFAPKSERPRTAAKASPPTTKTPANAPSVFQVLDYEGHEIKSFTSVLEARSFWRVNDSAAAVIDSRSGSVICQVDECSGPHDEEE